MLTMKVKQGVVRVEGLKSGKKRILIIKDEPAFDFLSKHFALIRAYCQKKNITDVGNERCLDISKSFQSSKTYETFKLDSSWFKYIKERIDYSLSKNGQYSYWDVNSSEN